MVLSGTAPPCGLPSFLFLINCFYFGFDLVLLVIIFMLPTRFKGASMFYFFSFPHNRYQIFRQLVLRIVNLQLPANILPVSLDGFQRYIHHA